MDITDILVVVDDVQGTGSRASAAFHVADRFGAVVNGLYVGLVPTIPSYVEVQLPEALKKQRDADVGAAAAAARAIFEQCASGFACAANWHEAVGRFPDVLGRVVGYARFADLTVIGYGPDQPIGPGFAEEIVLSSGAPVLLLPETARLDCIGKRILVGWNGSREATRALRDSIPFLQFADEVTLLTVRLGEADADETDDILVHLAHHGIEANLRQAHVSAQDVGDVILSRASETGADLIVMGAYGHARMRELALGGATRRILHKSTLPVLMSH